MSERRPPRNLRDVSHLFLSGSQKAHSSAPRSIVSIWLVVSDASLNRAHLAAGVAAAFARQGMCVSLLEVCSSLPNVGYYFGAEPAAYLAPVLDRGRLVSGVWNGEIRFCVSADANALERYEGDELPPSVPHVIIAAFPHPRERDAARVLASLQRATAALSGIGAAVPVPPDAIVAAGCGQSAQRAGALTAGMRDAFPQAAVFLVTDDPGAPRANEADERFVVATDLRASWARRTPPVERIFNELAGGLLQVVSQRRRKAAHAANG